MAEQSENPSADSIMSMIQGSQIPPKDICELVCAIKILYKKRSDLCEVIQQGKRKINSCLSDIYDLTEQQVKEERALTTKLSLRNDYDEAIEKIKYAVNKMSGGSKAFLDVISDKSLGIAFQIETPSDASIVKEPCT